jgi:hypothetical protein
MSACTGADENQPIDAGLQRALGMLHVGHVVIYEPAVRVRRLHDLIRRTQAGDLNRHAILLAQGDIAREPIVRCVHDLIDRERRDFALGVLPLERSELFGDLHEPFFEHRCGSCVERRKGTDHARLALLDDETRVRDDEQGRADDGQPQLPAQRLRNGHAVIPWGALPAGS